MSFLSFSSDKVVMFLKVTSLLKQPQKSLTLLPHPIPSTHNTKHRYAWVRTHLPRGPRFRSHKKAFPAGQSREEPLSLPCLTGLGINQDYPGGRKPGHTLPSSLPCSHLLCQVPLLPAYPSEYSPCFIPVIKSGNKYSHHCVVSPSTYDLI